MIEMFLEMKTLLTSFALRLSDLKDDDHHRYSSQITAHLLRIEDSSSVLLKGRNLIASLASQNVFTAEHETFFRSSKLMSRLIENCVLDELGSCSHLLKIFVIFGNDAMLLEMLLQENAVLFTRLFLSTLRCTVNSVEDFLVKFWLVKRTCDNIWIRNFLFQRDGVILEILAIMRTTSLHAGDALDVLTSFCEDSFFYDISVSPAQVIHHFGELFQCSSNTDRSRYDAEEVLLIFSEGLEKTCKSSRKFGQTFEKKMISDISEGISSSFIESGLLFILLNTLSVNDSSSEWRAKGANLLNILVRNIPIQEVFLEEPLGVLRCLVNSCDSFVDRGPMFMELVSIAEVIACNASAHGRLFESEIVTDIIQFIHEIIILQNTACEVNPEEITAQYLLGSLNVLDIITNTSEGSCVVLGLQQMKVESTLTPLLTHKNKSLSELVCHILRKIHCVPPDCCQRV
jgi:hypothetical protein